MGGAEVRQLMTMRERSLGAWGLLTPRQECAQSWSANQ